MAELKIPVLNDADFDSKAADLMKEIRERNTRYSQDNLHKCYENILFDYGRQWVSFDHTVQQFRPKRTKRWVPKPVTNKFAAVMRPLISNLAGIDPILQYAPVSEDPVNVATAKVGSRIVEIARQETNIAFTKLKLARLVGLTGNGWLISGYDNDVSYGVVPEQAERCQGCGNTIMADDIEKEGGCPFCKKAGRESPGFAPAFDEMTGQPIMGERPRGSMFTEVGSIFEMEYDHEADSFADSLYGLRMRSRDREWAKSRFNLSDDELKSGSMSPVVQQRYLQSLAYISPISYQLNYSKPFHENRVLVTELWLNPTGENPQGAYAIQVGETVVYRGPYKYHAPDSAPESPKPLRPLTHFGYQVAVGRVAFRTPADDLTSMQRTRNELECIYKLHSRRAANSIIWIPDGANMSKISGEEGLMIRYTAMSGVPAPHREAGLESPRFIGEWINLLDAGMEIVSGSVDVLRGEAPAGLEAYAALQALEAKAVQALAESRGLWNIGWAEWSRQMVGIFKEYCIDERDFSMQGENGAWSIQKFKSTDLRGGLRIIPDLTQQGPSSPVAMRAATEQLQRMGVLNVADPMERFRIVQLFGVPTLMQDMDLDTQAAAIENDTFFEIFVKGAQGEPPVVNPFIDNDLVHVASHRRFYLSDKGKQLGPLGQSILIGHMSGHIARIQQAQAAAMGQAGGPGKEQGGGKSGPSAGKATKSEAGSASQPARANDMGGANARGTPRKERVQEMKDEHNA